MEFGLRPGTELLCDAAGRAEGKCDESECAVGASSGGGRRSANHIKIFVIMGPAKTVANAGRRIISHTAAPSRMIQIIGDAAVQYLAIVGPSQALEQV